MMAASRFYCFSSPARLNDIIEHMAARIRIRFHQQLNDFLPASMQNSDIACTVDEHRSIKDLIESLGVPHPEVDLVFINGESAGFDYLLKDGDRISVYPAQATTDISDPEVSTDSPLLHWQPQAPGEARFVLDVHLGRLAAYLRMLGFDSLYRNDYHDPELADISARENRILLTCDRRLLMRKQIEYGYFVRSRQPKQQLLEVLSRFDLFNKIRPFSRCMHCNGLTRPVDKKTIEHRLLPKTRKYYDSFYQCQNCGKIYWQGSHYQKMENMIKNLGADIPQPENKPA